MKKVLSALVAATLISVTSLVMSDTANAQWGWRGGFHRFGYGCGCPRAYGAYYPRYRFYRPYAYAGYFPRYRFYRPYAYAGYFPRFRFYRPVRFW